MSDLIGKKFPVLDDGSVTLLDVMGSDADIANAARVSYGKGTRKVSEDAALIRYLWRNHHTSPFEMAEIKLHVRVPMDVTRQWWRHRTACLAEGTEVYFDLPGGIGRRGNQLYKVKIEDLWRKFQPTSATSRPERQGNPWFKRDRVKSMQLRQVNEDTLEIQRTQIVDVFKSGVKPVFRMTLSDGKEIESTSDHQFMFTDGWMTLGQATGLTESGGRAVWNSGDHFLYVNGSVTRSPWNKGKTYQLGPRKLSEAWIEANKDSRSGPASNFWKGGVSTERENIGRWTTQIAGKIHRRNEWTCQLCRQRASELHCHHIVPVWADESLAHDELNLTTLCGDCHRKIHGKELDYVVHLGGPPVKAEWVKRDRIPWNKLNVGKLVKIDRFEYVGEKMTYDLEVKGPFHNFIANGIVTHNSINEYSTRYSEAIDAMQATPHDGWRLQAKDNKQGSSGFVGGWPEGYRFEPEPEDEWDDEEQVADGPMVVFYDPETEESKGFKVFQDDETPTPGGYLSSCEKSFQGHARYIYEQRLKFGVAREQARKDLPLSTYTEAFWKCDIRNVLGFLAQRMDGHAQQEIREYANIIGNEIVAKLFPITWDAFQDYTLNAMTLTALDIQAIRCAMAGGSPATLFANDRERKECREKLERLGLGW